MINKILVGAALKAFEDILTAANVPYQVRDDEETRLFRKIWDECPDQDLMIRKTAPAIRKIVSREPYIFKKNGEPLVIRLNYLTRELEKDSFGEIMLERPDDDWRFTISVKKDANVLATMPVADRAKALYMNHEVNVFNEIDDFGERIFGVPCSNEYFEDMNEILMRIFPMDPETWEKLLEDDGFVRREIFAPMLSAIGREMPKICKDHPEAPGKLIEYFYGRIDYYYINPIDEVKVTRIGAVNSHACLGRIPDNTNLLTPSVKLPTELLDVRFANGRYGELSDDTIQFTFDGGWSVCVHIRMEVTPEEGRYFVVNTYLPVTPFGSYRDQVSWDAE